MRLLVAAAVVTLPLIEIALLLVVGHSSSPLVAQRGIGQAVQRLAASLG
jgi:hypothetical protein